MILAQSLRVTAFVLCSTALVAGCETRTEAPSLAGACFEVQVELPGDAAATPAYQPPPLVMLDTLGTPWPRRIEPLPGSIPSVHLVTSWNQVPGDTLELGWSTGPSGLLLRLHVSGDTLRGRAETISEVGMPLSGTATAIAVPCDAAVPAHHARQHPPMPAVALAGHEQALVIGMPFPRQALQFEEPSYERMILHEEPTGSFAGADSVVVSTDAAGTIVIMRLTFPTRAAADAAAQAIAVEHGQAPADPDGVVAWRDRERWITMSPRAEGVGAVLVIADPRYTQ